MIKKVVFITLFIGFILSISPVVGGIKPVDVQQYDLVLIDRWTYDSEEMDNMLSQSLGVWYNITGAENWHSSIYDHIEGDILTFWLDSVVNKIVIKTIIKSDIIYPTIPTPDDIDILLLGAQNFLIENWFGLFLLGITIPFLGYKIFSQ